MRAVVLRDGKLEVRSTADPKPGPGELLRRTADGWRITRRTYTPVRLVAVNG